MGQIGELEEHFLQYLKEMDIYREAVSLIQWDLRTKIPKNGVEARSEVVGLFSEKIHQMQTSDKMKRFIEQLKGISKNEIIEKAVEECEDVYNRNSKIPTNEYKEYVMLQSKSEAVWQEAREKSDFPLFQPYLERLVEYNKRFAEYWGYEDNIYDALLHNYEPGVTTKLLDDVFPTLRTSLTNLLQSINDHKKKVDSSILQVHFPKKNQENFIKNMIRHIGFDFDSGRLDETIHPFEITLNKMDVRITTRYDEEDFRMAVFGTIHETGHALYELNIHPKLTRTPLASGTSMGIHESQSLFWENFIGRSKSFWERYYPLFQSYAPEHFKTIDVKDFYKAINEVTPSFIRIEADELTYPLHIMIRYELEKALINGEIEVKDLPSLWNEKMKEYLGIIPQTNKEGVLQDIHWAGGDFGYFPSYALGLLYAAQFYDKLRKEIDVEGNISKGEFQPILKWLSSNIHQYGKMKKPLEILTDVTNESLNPDYLITYLTEKYTDIYQLT